MRLEDNLRISEYLPTHSDNMRPPVMRCREAAFFSYQV